MEEKKRIPLSFRKFGQLLEKYHYKITRIYITGDDCRFVEVKSPRLHKLFYIGIPPRYKVSFDDSFDEEYLYSIYKTDSENRYQKSYINIFGDILPCDVICVSSNTICHFDRDMNDFSYFKFGELDEPEDDDIPLEDDDPPQENLVKSLEDKFKDVKAKHSEVEMEFVEEEPPQKDDAIDLVFEDEDGNPIEPDTPIDQMLRAESGSPKKIHIDKHTIVKLNVPHESPVPSPAVSLASDSDDEEKEYQFNKTPSNIDKHQIDVGMIYVCIDLHAFFQVAKDFEESLTRYHDLLDNKEFELREIKMRKIEDLVTQFKVAAFDQLDELKKKEQDTKEQIKRLSSVLVSCEKLSAKGKFEDVSSIEEQTKNTIDDLNIELLKMRDRASQMFNKYITYIEDMLKID